MPTATTRRSTAKTKKKKPNGASSPRARLPAALAARATAAASAKTSRLRRDAHALLALIARRKREITEAFYDIGEALTKLKDCDTISALGRRSFAEVCEKDAGISVSVAERLVEIVRSLTREQALAMGQKKAMAMVTLAAATPEDDTAAGLYRKKSIALPGGKKVSPRSASANELEEAATAIRHRRSASAAGNGNGAPARGRTSTAEERTFAALLEKRLHQLGLDRARVTAVATKPGRGAISASSTSPSRRSMCSRRRSGAEPDRARIHPWGTQRPCVREVVRSSLSCGASLDILLMNSFTPAFRAKMVQRLLGPGRVSQCSLSRETGVPQGTLSQWVRQATTVWSDEAEGLRQHEDKQATGALR